MEKGAEKEKVSTITKNLKDQDLYAVGATRSQDNVLLGFQAEEDYVPRAGRGGRGRGGPSFGRGGQTGGQKRQGRGQQFSTTNEEEFPTL